MLSPEDETRWHLDATLENFAGPGQLWWVGSPGRVMTRPVLRRALVLLGRRSKEPGGPGEICRDHTFVLCALAPG